MSKKNKHKFWKPPFAQVFGPATAAEVTAMESTQVAQLIKNGKFGFAVDIAKQVHKRCGNAASESLLMDAYVARISSLVERNLDADAQALMEVVLERYPSARSRLHEMAAWFAARTGNLNALVQPLNDAALPPETRATISELIRCNVGDVAALSACNALSPEHPLRTAATAIVTGFKAVTSGPIDDASLALPEVSRHSPLAPWKLLVRAIAGFYRRDDQQCAKYLEAIEPDSAAARLAPPLRALLGQKIAGQKQTLTPAALSLVNQAGGGVEALRSTLEQLDEAFDQNNNHPRVLELIRSAMGDCQRHCPDLLVSLKQHAAVRAMTAGLNPERVISAMGGSSMKNAHFWRLMARSAEENRTTPASIPHACSLWEEFRKHAVHEGWFPADGPEAATLYLHMADLLSRLEDDDLEDMQEAFPEHFKGLWHYYADQPAAIAALAPPKGRQDTYYLRHEALFERACQADPRSENFQRWLNWAKRNRPAAVDAVTARWRDALPGDIPPLLELMESAERTNALKRAFHLMEEAERIDGLNPEVRKARLRLLISMATRHLKQKKLHLARPELEQIQALPQAQQGDRPAFVSALWWVWWTLRDGKQEAATARAEVEKMLKSEVAASMLLAGVARMCKLMGQTPENGFRLRGERVAVEVGRACALGEDMGAHIEILPQVAGTLLNELSADVPVSDPVALSALGDAAVDQSNFELAYAVSSAGLAHSATGQARFLFLRARALPPWEEERCNACIKAASELARRDRDLELLNKIGEWREEELDLFGFGRQRETAMSTEETNKVIQEERKQKKFPAWGPAFNDSYECNCPACRAARRASPDDFEDMPDFGRPPKELMDMVDEFGPEMVAKAMAEMIAGQFGARPKRKKRRRTSVRSQDLPF